MDEYGSRSSNREASMASENNRWFTFELRRIKDTNGRVRAAFVLALVALALASVSLFTDSWQNGFSTATVRWNKEAFTVAYNLKVFNKYRVKSGLWRVCCLDEGTCVFLSLSHMCAFTVGARRVTHS